MAWQARLKAIHAEPSPVVRNYLITSAYDDLSTQTASVLGGVDANWLTFGKWASFTAGKFIRGEGAPINWGADKVADGNLAIIGDIAPQFVRFLELTDSDSALDLATLVAADEHLGGNPIVCEAFCSYAQALDAQALDAQSPEGDAGTAQTMLRGNLLVAHHEQALADDFIDEAMPLGGLFGIVTTKFVTLNIPEGELDPCDQVPLPRYLAGEQWPAALNQISDPRLVALARSYGQEWQETQTSGAANWEVFNDRMGYIAMFFRAYQRDPALQEPVPAANG